jgi:hypothetical protein
MMQELVNKVAGIAALSGRAIASPKEARTLLGLGGLNS